MIMIIKCDNRDAFKSLDGNQISPFVLQHKFNDLKDGMYVYHTIGIHNHSKNARTIPS